MPLNEKLPNWENAGFEPTESKKTEGFKELEKPPAGWFNWFFNRTYKVLAELREKVFLKEDAASLATKTSLNEHIQDLTAHPKFAEITQTGNDITINLNIGSNADYKKGMGASFEVKEDATGPVRLRFGTWVYKNLKNQRGTNITNLKAGSIITVRYSLSRDSFILQGEGSGVDLTDGINKMNKILQL